MQRQQHARYCIMMETQPPEVSRKEIKCGCHGPQQRNWTHTGRQWKVRVMKGPLTVEISNGPRIKCAHVNRLHHQLQPDIEEQPVSTKTTTSPWQAPQIDHFILPPPATESRRYPTCQRAPLDRYEY